ncbi:MULTISPECIES: hypothetical protein [unclassified Wolbachia]|nr:MULTISPECIES: hypothetical protein [unclassified Wolbachia]
MSSQCLDYLDLEKLIVHYATFSIKSWIPVSRTGMTSFIMQHRVTLQRSYSCARYLSR